jgi:hypothetical protein
MIIMVWIRSVRETAHMPPKKV